MPVLTAAAASDIFRREPDRYLDVGQGEVAYRKVGEGPDVLFVHGWPVHGATFRTLLPYLAEHVTCHLIDMVGVGSSRWDDSTEISIANHVHCVRRAIDLLELDSVAVVGHDSGGMIARHAIVGDERVRALGLIDTEPTKVGWRFKSFISSRHLPGFGAGLGWLAGKPKLRRNGFVLGDAFVNRDLLDGEFDEFFLQPLANDERKLAAGMQLLKSFKTDYIKQLAGIHARIDIPVQLVWGVEDKFFTIEQAREMVGTFANAELSEIAGAGLFSHEEKPAEVAAALLPTLTGQR